MSKHLLISLAKYSQNVCIKCVECVTNDFLSCHVCKVTNPFEVLFNKQALEEVLKSRIMSERLENPIFFFFWTWPYLHPSPPPHSLFLKDRLCKPWTWKLSMTTKVLCKKRKQTRQPGLSVSASYPYFMKLIVVLLKVLINHHWQRLSLENDAHGLSRPPALVGLSSARLLAWMESFIVQEGVGGGRRGGWRRTGDSQN